MAKTKIVAWTALLLAISTLTSFAGEADIHIPDLDKVAFTIFGQHVSGMAILYVGIVICALGALFGLIQYSQTKALPVHSSMANVSNIIWETCKTYVQQQGKFLVMLWVLIAVCMVFYFVFLPMKDPNNQYSGAQLVGRGLVILLA